MGDTECNIFIARLLANAKINGTCTFTILIFLFSMDLVGMWLLQSMNFWSRYMWWHHPTHYQPQEGNSRWWHLHMPTEVTMIIACFQIQWMMWAEQVDQHTKGEPKPDNISHSLEMLTKYASKTMNGSIHYIDCIQRIKGYTEPESSECQPLHIILTSFRWICILLYCSPSNP